MVLFFEKWFQHISNPLHVYCRLLDLGLDTVSSKRISIFYEKYFFHYFMKGGRSAVEFLHMK